MSLRRSLLVLAAFALLVAGCATQPPPPEPPTTEVAGHFTMGEQSRWFEPCTPAPDAPWWASFEGESAAQFEEAARTGKLVSGERYFVRFAAVETSVGKVASREAIPEVHVKQILEIRPATDHDCP